MIGPAAVSQLQFAPAPPQMEDSMKKWLALILACLALGVVIAGCGGDDDDSGGDDGGASTQRAGGRRRERRRDRR